MNKLKVIGIDGSYPCFIKIGDMIEEYEVVLYNFRPPRIKVKPHHYLSVNGDNMSLFEFGLCGKYNLEQVPIFINVSDVAVIKEDEGERKMKYVLRDTAKSWWVEGMVVEGEINGRSEILEINAVDICKLNKDIMSKEQIIECMRNPRYAWGKAYLKPLDPFKLTRLEYELLKFNQKQGAKYICKDASYGDINISETKPTRGVIIWHTSGSKCAYMRGYSENLFKFVKWEDEPYLIEDILENYEIVEDE